MKKFFLLVMVLVTFVFVAPLAVMSEQHQSEYSFSGQDKYEHLCVDTKTELTTKSSINPSLPFIMPDSINLYSSVNESEITSNSFDMMNYKGEKVNSDTTSTSTVEGGECLVYQAGGALFGLIGGIDTSVVQVEKLNDGNDTDGNDTESDDIEDNSQDEEDVFPKVQYRSEGANTKGSDADLVDYSERTTIEQKDPTLRISGSIVSEGLGKNLTDTRIEEADGELTVRVNFVDDAYSSTTTRYDYSIEVSNPERYRQVSVRHNEEVIKTFDT